MAVEISGELVQLLSLLSVRVHGATQHELTKLGGVSASLIYKAVTLDLVQARPEHNGATATAYRYHLLDPGRALLSRRSKKVHATLLTSLSCTKARLRMRATAWNKMEAFSRFGSARNQFLASNYL